MEQSVGQSRIQVAHDVLKNAREKI